MKAQTTIQYPAVTVSHQKEIRWFSYRGCVEYDGNDRCVYISGTLIGKFKSEERFVRNLILLGLDQDKTIRKGKLGKAFDLTDEYLRRMRQRVAEGGLEAVPTQGPGGQHFKLDEKTRRDISRLFDDGLRAKEVYDRAGKKAGISYQTVLRMRNAWKIEKELRETKCIEAEEIGEQLSFEPLQEIEPEVGEVEASESRDAPLGDAGGGKLEKTRGGKSVQHAGGLVMVSAVHRLGLYDAAMADWPAQEGWRERLRLAMDALVLALGMGQKCVEGVRRLENKTAGILLRTEQVPSESWVRRIIKRYLDEEGSAKMHLGMLGVYIEDSRTSLDRPAVFYVDNHMRPYTGQETLLKGWRMQDKRAKPGATDYYVHDEDGRPVFRVDVASHDSLSRWLAPIAGMLRDGLGKEQKILVAFDRAGAYPNQMVELRENGFEFVTYERKPYESVPASAFGKKVVVGGEEIGIHEKRLANLKKGRGRVRRIALRMPDKSQVNLLAVSREPAERLVEIMLGRWIQENAFKHGKERWGIDQLDSRKVVEYAPDTVITNPARRKIEYSLRLLRNREGTIRTKLARKPKDRKRVEKLEEELKEELKVNMARQEELMSIRPFFSKKAKLEETDLAGKLVHHDTHYKTFIDTVRIACANVESDLAGELSPYLNKKAEAKKALQNLFSSPGDIRVNGKSITISIDPIGRKDERKAFDVLFGTINRWKLTLPGDPQRRFLRFRSQQ